VDSEQLIDSLATVYLEQILSTLDYRPPAIRGGEKFTPEQSQSFRDYFERNGVSADVISKLEILRKTDRIDYQVSRISVPFNSCLTSSKLVAAIVKHIVNSSERGAILIFMPGVQEIRQCIEALRATSLGQTSILPLHANLSSDEQKRVFASTPWRKIVVATNVAEVWSLFLV
jgi:ATP-dependent RNA helicase DHX57